MSIKKRNSKGQRKVAIGRRATPKQTPMLSEMIAALETPEGKAILEMQRSYAKAMLEGGNVPPEILAKYQRMQELSAKVSASKGKQNLRAREELDRIAAELLPYFHFKVDNNPTKQ